MPAGTEWPRLELTGQPGPGGTSGERSRPVSGRSRGTRKSRKTPETGTRNKTGKEIAILVN